MTGQLDIAKLIRVKAAIDNTLANGKEATDAPGLSRAYIAHRREVASMLEGALLAEFERLYPEDHFRGVPTHGPDLRRQYGEVVSLISGVSGWLDGIIQVDQLQEQVRSNADAYAREKVKAERGIGFKE